MGLHLFETISYNNAQEALGAQITPHFNHGILTVSVGPCYSRIYIVTYYIFRSRNTDSHLLLPEINLLLHYLWSLISLRERARVKLWLGSEWLAEIPLPQISDMWLPPS